MCCGTRVCQCLPVSTPTYLCKSFNLTPPACRAYPRERSYLETYSYSLPRRWGTCCAVPFDPQQPYDRVSLVGYRQPCLYQRKILRHACVTRVVASEEISAEIDVSPIRLRAPITHMWYRIRKFTMWLKEARRLNFFFFFFTTIVFPHLFAREMSGPRKITIQCM